MEQADANSNAAQRAQQYAGAEQLLLDQMASCSLFQTALDYEVRPWIHGWALDAEGLPPNDVWATTWLENH